MDWNFVKVYLAVLNEKSITAAATTLGMSDSTLFRHIANYEKEYGKLFVRKNGEWHPTTFGESLTRHAQAIKEGFGDVERLITAQDTTGISRIRITAPTSFSYGHLPRLLESLKEKRPDIDIDLLVSNDTLCLNTRQADVAIRVTSTPPDNFIGTKICDINWSIYGGYGYLSKHGSPKTISDLHHHKLIGASGHLVRGRSFSWLQKEFGAKFSICTDDLVAMLYLTENNHGLSLLPDEFNRGDVKRLFTVDELDTNSLWVLTHSDYRGVERVRAVAKYLAENLAKI